jgi:hypothetical protein
MLSATLIFFFGFNKGDVKEIPSLLNRLGVFAGHPLL